MTKEQLAGSREATAVAEILAPALGQEDARKRREAVLAKDKRTPEEVVAPLSELDALIDMIVARLNGTLAPIHIESAVPPLPAETPPIPSGALGPGTPSAEVEIAPPEIPVDAAIEVTPTRHLKPVPDVPAPAAADGVALPLIAPTASDTPAVNLLYEDIIWLVSIDDWGGALISLERLLVMAKLDGHVKEFVDVNEVKLLNLYESYLGPFTKTPKTTSRTLDNTMPTAYARTEKLARVLELIDGDQDMSSLFKLSPYSPLETCSAINQLRRSGLLEV